MFIRLGHYALGKKLAGRIFIFADDGLGLFPVSQFRRSAISLFALYAFLGFDVKWPKVRSGTDFQ